MPNYEPILPHKLLGRLVNYSKPSFTLSFASCFATADKERYGTVVVCLLASLSNCTQNGQLAVGTEYYTLSLKPESRPYGNFMRFLFSYRFCLSIDFLLARKLVVECKF